MHTGMALPMSVRHDMSTGAGMVKSWPRKQSIFDCQKHPYRGRASKPLSKPKGRCPTQHEIRAMVFRDHGGLSAAGYRLPLVFGTSIGPRSNTPDLADKGRITRLKRTFNPTQIPKRKGGGMNHAQDPSIDP